MFYEYTAWVIHLPTHYVTIKQTDPQNPIMYYIQCKYSEKWEICLSTSYVAIENA